MKEITLTASEIELCQAVVHELSSRFGSIEDEELMRQATICAHELPRGLRTALNDFRLREDSSALVISGYPVDDEKIGRTPEHWGAQARPSDTLAEDVFFSLCACLLGEPFGWATQQGQRLMHDILPIRGHEMLQLNSASTSPIWWHVEDAFHPYRAEYIGMMCLRNPDKVATTYGAMADVRLPRDVVEILFQPRFIVKPDQSHQIQADVDLQGSSQKLELSYQRIDSMNNEPNKIAVLFGDPAAPYLRLDPYFMDESPHDPEAMAAFTALTAEIDRVLTEIALQPGQVLFVDNYRAVHGRKPFVARFDGQDRWLKRLNVTRDLRKSRHTRSAPDARVLF